MQGTGATSTNPSLISGSNSTTGTTGTSGTTGTTGTSGGGGGGGSSNTAVIGAVAGAVGALALIAVVAGVLISRRRAAASAQQLPMHMPAAGAAGGMYDQPMSVMPAAAAHGLMQPSGPGSVGSAGGAQYPRI